MKLLSTLFAILVGFVLPIGAGIYLSAKKKEYMKPVLLGTLTFFVFQIVIRIPILQLVLPKMTWYAIFSTTQPVMYALFLGATAALFEEGGRWIVMRLLMNNKNRLTDGIAFGIGHGGIEAVYILGINAIALLFVQVPSVTSGQMFAGGFERLCTMVIHIAFSVMVLKSIVLKKPVWLLLAFVLHTAIDMAAGLMQQAGASIFTMETTVGLFALILLGYIIFEYKKYKGAEIR